MKIKIVSFDPALSNLGIALMSYDLETGKLDLEQLRLVQTEATDLKGVRKNSDDLERGRKLHQGMIEACEGRVLAIAEVPVGSQSARAMASYGVCVGLLAACPIPLIEVNPGEVKMAGPGIKTATKQEMIEWALQRFPHDTWLMRKSKGELVPVAANEHLADACAAACAGIKTQQFQQAVALYKAVSLSC